MDNTEFLLLLWEQTHHTSYCYAPARTIPSIPTRFYIHFYTLIYSRFRFEAIMTVGTICNTTQNDKKKTCVGAFFHG